MKRKIVRGWLQILIGLAVFAYGVHLTISAGIGLAPWDCLGTGISNHTPFNYGVVMTGVAVIVLIIDLLLRERIGCGTVIDALFTGNAVQFFNDRDPFSNIFLPLIKGKDAGVVVYAALILILMAGLCFMAFGQFLYMRNGQGCGPRDSLLLGIGKRLPHCPIDIVEILLWAVVLLTGFLLGGPVGIGTIITTFGAGVAMQLVFRLVRFEPRNIQHKSVKETMAELLGT